MAECDGMDDLSPSRAGPAGESGGGARVDPREFLIVVAAGEQIPNPRRWAY